MSIVMSMMASYFAFLCFLVMFLFPSSCHLWICDIENMLWIADYLIYIWNFSRNDLSQRAGSEHGV